MPSPGVGHYRFVGKLGSGGMGEVYRAGDKKLGREVHVMRGNLWRMRLSQ